MNYTKVCRSCHSSLVVNEENFYKDKSTRDGFRMICIECIKSQTRKRAVLLKKESKVKSDEAGYKTTWLNGDDEIYY